MEIFNQIGKKASEAYKITADKTGKMAKETKLKLKMGDLKSKINDLYQEIGKRVYENHLLEDNEACNKEVEEKCIKIDVLSDEVESLLQQCLQLRNKRQCKNCHTEIEIGAKFCHNCGEKQEENKENVSVEENKEHVEENVSEVENKEHVEENVSEVENKEHVEENLNEVENKECVEESASEVENKEHIEENSNNLEKTVEIESNISENLEITEEEVMNIGSNDEEYQN